MKTKQLVLTLTFALTALGLNLAQAQAPMDHSNMGRGTMAMPGTQAEAMSEGEVKKIDLQAQTITLKHGPMTNLAMPGMTMAFKVKTAAMLAKVKVGDTVKFVAEMPAGTLTIASMARVQ